MTTLQDSPGNDLTLLSVLLYLGCIRVASVFSRIQRIDLAK